MEIIALFLVVSLFLNIIHWTLKLFGYGIWDLIAFPYRAFWWMVDIEKHTTRKSNKD